MHSLYGSLFLWLNKNLCIVFIYKNRKKVMHLSDYLLAYPFVTKPFSINLHAFHYNMFAHAKSKLYRLKSLIFTNSYYMTNLFYPGDLTNFYHSHLIIPLLLFFLFLFKYLSSPIIIMLLSPLLSLFFFLKSGICALSIILKAFFL